MTQLLQFQKKRHGTKKKKKKEKSSGSVASGASETSERPASNEHRNNSKQLPVDQQVKAKKTKEDVEDISQTDTDYDAPSIHSDQGSPIPFEVSKVLT